MVTVPIMDEREFLARSYQMFIVRGILAILFALLILLMPGTTLLTFVFVFGIFAIAEGVSNIVAAVRRRGAKREPWWSLLLQGIVSVAAGLLAFFMPDLTAVALLYIIAGWVVLKGVFEIVSAIRLRKQISGEWLLGLSGLLSIVFGVLLALFPGAGALALIVWIGAYAFAFGVLQIVLGFRLRKVARADRDADGFTTTAPSH